MSIALSIILGVLGHAGIHKGIASRDWLLVAGSLYLCLALAVLEHQIF